MIMKKFLLLCFLMAIFSVKMSFAQTDPPGGLVNDFGTIDPNDEIMVCDFYLVGDIPGHYFMEAQNYSPPADPTVTVAEVAVTIGGNNGSEGPGATYYYQRNPVYYTTPTLYGDSNMDIYDFYFSDWEYANVDWQLIYSNGKVEWIAWDWGL